MLERIRSSSLLPPASYSKAKFQIVDGLSAIRNYPGVPSVASVIRSYVSRGNILHGQMTTCVNVLLTSVPVGQEIALRPLAIIVLAVLRDLIRISFRTRAKIIAENLFLRRQLAL
jgi:hypothetical protein